MVLSVRARPIIPYSRFISSRYHNVHLSWFSILETPIAMVGKESWNFAFWKALLARVSRQIWWKNWNYSLHNYSNETSTVFKNPIQRFGWLWEEQQLGLVKFSKRSYLYAEVLQPLRHDSLEREEQLRDCYCQLIWRTHRKASCFGGFIWTSCSEGLWN